MLLYEHWNITETNVALLGLKLAAASSAGKNERQTLLFAVEYWLEKMTDTDGMTEKFPTIEEMISKRCNLLLKRTFAASDSFWFSIVTGIHFVSQ
jgi:hypothetical protein